MRHGKITPGNVEQNSTGYLKLATGTTAQRPTTGAEGMMRTNSETKAVEYFVDGQWRSIFGTGELSVEQIPSALGGLSDPLLFIRNKTTNVKLSVDALNWQYYTSNSQSNTWLQLNSDLVGSTLGYIVPYDGTIAGMTLIKENNNASFNVYLYFGDTLVTSSLIQATQNNDVAVNLDHVNFTRGTRIRARVSNSSGGGLFGDFGGCILQVVTKWRAS